MIIREMQLFFKDTCKHVFIIPMINVILLSIKTKLNETLTVFLLYRIHLFSHVGKEIVKVLKLKKKHFL